MEIRGLLQKSREAEEEDIRIQERPSFVRFCTITKTVLLSLCLDTIKFASAKSLTIFLEDLNHKLLRELHLVKILFKPKDYDNLEHLYYIVGRFTSLRSLSLPIIEHQSVPVT